MGDCDFACMPYCVVYVAVDVREVGMDGRFAKLTEVVGQSSKRDIYVAVDKVLSFSSVLGVPPDRLEKTCIVVCGITEANHILFVTQTVEEVRNLFSYF
jgi:hypothetical protein